MTKIDDLVVVNKSDLQSWIGYIDTFPLYPEDREKLLSLKQEPLKPFIEDAFENGYYSDMKTGSCLEDEKQTYFNKVKS